VKRHLITVSVVVLLLAGVTAFNMYFQQPRLTQAHQQASEEAQAQLEEAEEKAQDVRLAQQEGSEEKEGSEKKGGDAGSADNQGGAAAKKDEEPMEETSTQFEEVEEWPADAPDEFKLKFECSNGDFVIDVHKDWAPLGAQRFYTLAKEDFYDGARFFRVVPGFVVQFGIAGDPTVNAMWREQNIKDDPVKKSNKRGYVTFAKTNAPNSRTTQIFINLGDNENLDAMGFAPFGEVIHGMDEIDDIESKYGQQPNQGAIQQQGNEYLKENFPDLDYIKDVKLVK